jgi:hypothetical protein
LARRRRSLQATDWPAAPSRNRNRRTSPSRTSSLAHCSR